MRKKENVSALIRQVLDSGVEVASDVAAVLKEKHGLTVAVPYISVVKWKWGNDKSKTKPVSVRETKVNGEVVDYVLSCGSFDAAKSRLQSTKERMLLKLVSKHHGVDGAVKAIETLEKQYASLNA